MNHASLAILLMATTLSAAPALARKDSPDASVAGAPSDSIEMIKASGHRDRFRTAEQALLRVLRNDPDQLEANLQLGYLKGYQLDKDGAYRCFLNAAKLHPASLEAQVMLVHACLDLERADEAFKLAENTIETWSGKSPDKELWSKLYVGLGIAQGLKAKREGFFALTKYGPAVRSNLEKALALDSDNALAVYALGRYYLNAPRLVGGDPAKGLSFMVRAIKLDPPNHKIRAAYYHALKDARQKAEADAQLARYQADFGDIPGAMRALSEQATGP